MNSKDRAVVFQQEAAEGLRRGINQMADALRPTYGARPRVVAIAGATPDLAPELLDSGNVILRRVLELPDRDIDMGAMFVRRTVWRQHELTGDGTATAAILLQSIYNQGATYLAAGNNAMTLRRHLQEGLALILDELDRMAIRVEGEKAVAHVAASVCHDTEIAEYLGEIFSIIGEYGRLEIREGQRRTIGREYVEGVYWDGGILSKEMLSSAAQPGDESGVTLERTLVRAEIHDAGVLIYDGDIVEPEDLYPVLTLALKADIRRLLIIAGSVSERVLSMLLINRHPQVMLTIPVKIPGDLPDETAMHMEDLAYLTGGHAFSMAAGESIEHATLADLGRARRAWADASYFGIAGGGGDSRELRRHIARLRAAFSLSDDGAARKKLRDRIGRLLGGTAVMWVGAATESEITFRRELAERAAEAVRGALMTGIVPGGGSAYLACRRPLRERLAASSDPDQRAAYRILIRALEEPARVLAINAGISPGEVVQEIDLLGPGYAYDVAADRMVAVEETGLWDTASVLKMAITGAVGSAALALTTGVVVHHKK
jgi:chaperonin GroEL